MTAAYDELISSICDLEPYTGWSGADLPMLTIPQVQIVMAAKGADVLDYLELDAQRIAAALIDPTYPTQLGVHLGTALEQAARDSVWHDVLTECERRDAEREREKSDARWASGDRRSNSQVAADLAGVPRELR